MKNVLYYDFPIGKVGIIEENDKLTEIFFGDGPQAGQKETSLIKETVKQLQEYFAGQRREFSLPLAPRGTEFQQAVWQALTTIPYGETRSYKQIAEQIGNSRACRAVGMANNRNPISIVIPCHRVIGSDGRLVGYGGGLDVKQLLLELEGADCIKPRAERI